MLEWLEGLGFSVWVREGETIWAFPTILTLHTFGLGLLVGASTVVNLRLLGIGRLPLSSMRPLFSLMWGGFWLNAVTGTMLFMADATRRGTDLLFMAKMACVAIGVWTVVLIQRAAFAVPDNPGHVAPQARTLAILSLIAWTAAVTAGRLLAYIS